MKWIQAVQDKMPGVLVHVSGYHITEGFIAEMWWDGEMFVIPHCSMAVDYKFPKEEISHWRNFPMAPRRLSKHN